MPAGQLISLSATQPIKRTVTDRIVMIDPYSIAGITALGLNNESKFAFVNAPGLKYEWLMDTFSPRSTTMNTTALTSDSALTQITVATGAYFKSGDVVLIDDEYMRITTEASNVIDVSRAWGGTQATHANSSTVYLVGQARREGTSAVDSNWTEPSTGYNFSSILQKSIEVSRSNALLNRYGIPDVVDREIDKAMDELMMLINLQLYHGQRVAGSTSVPYASSFGGLETFISTNKTDVSSAALTQKHLEDEIAQCYDAGGAPNLILCNTWVKRKIASFYEGSIRTERSESTGGMTIDTIMSAVGVPLNIVLDRHCPAAKCYMLDQRFLGFITLDPFFEEDLGKSKDTAYFGQVVGEYGFVVQFEKAHSWLYGISTSS